VTTTMPVPFLDLTAQYRTIEAEVDAAMASVIADNAFVRGRFVEAFEVEYAESYGVEHCIGVANGTDAIYIALKMLGVGPGDEVITAANSWISSSEVISQTGATPVFADVEPGFFTLDPADLKERVTDRTRAVIPVHLFGQPAAMDEIMAVAANHNLAVVEDTAQAHFATINGALAGAIGAVGTFSFYPGKNLGAYGDAGCLITDDAELARRIRMFANHGSDPSDKHNHRMEGINSRLDGLQAAVLSVKLRHIREWNRMRAFNAEAYAARLSGLGDLELPDTRPGASHVFHLYCIRSAQRDDLRAYLAEHGVATGIHYPTALPLLEAYDHLGYTAADFPVAARYQNEILSLPMYPELSEDQIAYVGDVIEQFFEAP